MASQETNPLIFFLHYALFVTVQKMLSLCAKWHSNLCKICINFITLTVTTLALKELAHAGLTKKHFWHEFLLF